MGGWKRLTAVCGVVGLGFGLGSAPRPALAWNSAGHRAIASLAYRQLDGPARQKLAAVLRLHPAHATLWADRASNGPDPVLNLFWNASVFPDEARSEPWRRYGRSAAHYVNYLVRADQGGRVDPPVEGENVVNSYVGHLRQIRNPKVTPEDRALHLSWVFHQAGDVHQPLHAVARFSKALPKGDRGGNGVTFPNPHSHGPYGNNLHAYWDDRLGSDEAPAAVEALADGLAAEYPAAGFARELQATGIGQWAQESVEVAVKTVYNNLDPEITTFSAAPLGYEADATRAARRRAALAGYRLAEELRRLADALP